MLTGDQAGAAAAFGAHEVGFCGLARCLEFVYSYDCILLTSEQHSTQLLLSYCDDHTVTVDRIAMDICEHRFSFL